MVCPRCKNSHDLLQYIKLQEIEEFENETTPCYKCPSCKWIFAPAGQMPQDMYKELSDKMEILLKNSNKDCVCQT